MTDSPRRTFSSDFKRFFLRGLVVLLPSVLTLWIVVKAYQFVDSTIAEPINHSVRIGLNKVAPYWSPLGENFHPTDEEVEAARAAGGSRVANTDLLQTQLRMKNIEEWWSERWYLDLIGLLIAIVSVYIAGRLLGGYLGRQVYWKIERLITSLPIFRQVYPYVKQIVDFLFSDDQPLKFNRVVVVEYPRKGIWSLGFQTGGPFREISSHLGDAVTVFIPSSPTPFTGYTITVSRTEIIEVPITVEEAIRFTVSGGVLIPDRQRIDHAQTPPRLGSSKERTSAPPTVQDTARDDNPARKAHTT